MTSQSSPSAAEWTRTSERGSLPLIRLMVWFSVALGRTVGRVPLRIISAYFLLFGGKSGRATREFLRRCLGREPTIAERYRTYFTFASTLHDRIYFLRNRFDLFDVERHGHERIEDDEGALLMGAHHGSFEAMRACGRGMAHRRVVMVMYEETAQRMNNILATIAPEALQDIVPLGRIESMLHVVNCLDAGALVGILADRTPGHESTIAVPFLGEEAAFPLGPMRMAAVLRRRVFFMTGLYRGGNRYDLHFEELADFTDLEGLTRAERDQRVRDAVVRYAGRLEHYCREAPHNWFNFFDFWKRGA
jgi:predicted LPLAT superfamily acyltransferase